jgi:hypothetical protein
MATNRSLSAKRAAIQALLCLTTALGVTGATEPPTETVTNGTTLTAWLQTATTNSGTTRTDSAPATLRATASGQWRATGIPTGATRTIARPLSTTDLTAATTPPRPARSTQAA